MKNIIQVQINYNDLKIDKQMEIYDKVKQTIEENDLVMAEVARGEALQSDVEKLAWDTCFFKDFVLIRVKKGIKNEQPAYQSNASFRREI